MTVGLAFLIAAGALLYIFIGVAVWRVGVHQDWDEGMADGGFSAATGCMWPIAGIIGFVIWIGVRLITTFARISDRLIRSWVR